MKKSYLAKIAADLISDRLSRNPTKVQRDAGYYLGRRSFLRSAIGSAAVVLAGWFVPHTAFAGSPTTCCTAPGVGCNDVCDEDPVQCANPENWCFVLYECNNCKTGVCSCMELYCSTTPGPELCAFPYKPGACAHDANYICTHTRRCGPCKL
jgi:hypothetical protein